jgi:hypothetical protein
MAEEPVNNEAPVTAEGRLTTVLIGSVLIVLTTTLPYITLINAFLFAGIVFGGAVAVYYYIIRNQVRLSYGAAFVLGALSGIGGGMLSVFVSYLLLEFFDYRPGLESLKLLADWGSSVAPEQSGTFKQLMQRVMEPVEITVADLLVSMVFSGLFYAPLAGLGGRLAVFLLKRQARKSAQVS